MKKWLLLIAFSGLCFTSLFAQQAGVLSFPYNKYSISSGLFVQAPNHSTLNFNQAITLEAWINPINPTTLIQNIISKSTSTNNTGYILRTKNKWTSISFLLNTSGITGNFTDLTVNFGTAKLNTWSHIAATFDGFWMRLYINGTLAGSKEVIGTFSTNNNPLTIGNQPGYNEFFAGSMDEVRIWNRALTQCEIQSNKDCQLGANQTGLALYYNFNPGLISLGASTLNDESNNGNTGTLTLQNSLATLTSLWKEGIINTTCTPYTPVTPTISASSTNITQGAQIELFATGGTSYSWSGPNNFTSTEQNPIILNAQREATGVYTVLVSTGSCSLPASLPITVVAPASGLNFDGLGSKVLIPNNEVLNVKNALTIESWIYPTSNSKMIQSVLSKSSSNENNSYIFPRTDDAWQTMVFYLKINGEWEKLAYPYPGINQWHHVAASYDGNEMKLYLDGKVVANRDIVGTISTNNNELVLGDQIGFNEKFKGNMDEVRIWNRVLTECEINLNKNCELGSNPNSLVAYYKFNQGLQSSDNSGIKNLIDASSANNNGSLDSFSLSGTPSNWSFGRVNGGASCNIFEAPVIVAGNDGPVYEVGTPAQLTASDGGSSYAWTGPNGFTSALQNPILPEVAKSQTGTYTVKITKNGCEGIARTSIAVAFRAKGLHFDGIDDQITVNASSSLNNISAAITLESWIYPTDNIRPIQDIMAKSSATNNNGYIFPRTDDGWKNFIFYLHLDGRWVSVEAPYASLNEWHHVAATYDGNEMKIYLDGVLAATKPATGKITMNTENLTIGQQPGFIEHYTGKVDEARVWNRALNLCEILNNKDCELNMVRDGLVAYYKFNQGFADIDNSSITTLVDSSGLNNNGRIDSFTLNGSVSNWTLAGDVGGVCKIFTPVVVSIQNKDVFVEVNKTLNLTASGADSYSWTGPNGFSSNIQNPTLINVLSNASGSYRVVGTGASSACTDTAYTNVVVNLVAEITPNGPTSFCPGSSVKLTGTTGVNYTYQWYLNGNPINGATAIDFTATQQGLYSYKITDRYNTTATSSALQVSIIPLPVVDPIASSSTNVCVGNTITVSNATVGGVWSSSNTSLAAVSNTGTVTGVGAGTVVITYTVTNENGCVAAVSTAVTVNASSTTLTISAASATTFCEGGSVKLTASGASSYLWSNGSTEPFIVVSSSGNYTVSSQELFGCSPISAPITVVVNALPAAPVISSSNGLNTICGQNTVTLNSTPAASYLWSNGSTASTITVNETGVYTVTITDANGCSASSNNFSITPGAISATPTVSTSGATTFCQGGSVTLTAPSASSYLWSNNATTQSITVSTTGNYSVQVTNSNSCISASSAPVFVNVHAFPIVNAISPGTTTFITGSSSTLTNSTSNGTWSSSNTNIATVSSNGLVTALTPGNTTISYTVQGAGGCNTTVTASVNVTLPPVTATITPQGATQLCANGSVVLNANTGNGYTYQWNLNGLPLSHVTAASYTATQAGTYTVTITLNNYSVTSAPITVTINPAITATITVPNSGFEGLCNNKLTLQGHSNAVNPTYTWSGPNNFTKIGQTLDLGLTDANGTYLLTVTDGKGCSSTALSNYTYDKSSVLGSYTILAFKEAKLGVGNKVMTGSVGVMNANGMADFKKNSSVTGAGSFVKAPIIDNKAAGINILSTIYGAVSVTLPQMLYNTSNTRYLANRDVSVNGNQTISGNYNTIRIKKGAMVTLTGDIFGSITIEQGARVRFTATTLKIASLKVYDGSDANKTYVSFAQNTKVLVSTQVNIGSQVIVNNENNSVTFYVDNMASSGDKFSVKGGGTIFNANIYMPYGKLKVVGNSGTTIDVYMNGLFIAEEVQSETATIWNGNNCTATQASNQDVNLTSITSESVVSTNKTDRALVSSENELKVTVMGNPTTSYFTIKLESKHTAPVNLRVVDGMGRSVDAKSNLNPNSTFQIGHNYQNGTYFAEIMQGSQRKVIQLMKARQ